MSDEAQSPLTMGEGLLAYIRAGDETTLALLENRTPLVEGLLRYDGFFCKGLWEPEALTPLASLLFAHAHMMFMAGARLALSGHSASIFSPLRTALEAACYGLIVERSPGLAETWFHRNRGARELKAARDAFTVKTALAHLTAHESIRLLVEELYEASIDWGAHPNLRGLAGHLRFNDERSDGTLEVTLTALYGPGWQVSRSLVACLDFGLAIAAVIILAPSDTDPGLMNELRKLSDLKNELAEQLQGGT
jgi:hypothetical protein